MSAPAVYLHIGAPKTGTTYLQDRLGRNARRLAEHDVHVPRLNPVTAPAMSHFRGALDLLDQDWGGTPGHADGAWPELARRIRAVHRHGRGQPRDPGAGAAGPGSPG